ncbi:MAG: hypothetical protein ABSE45_07355 [Candidatus Acidiferrales bacterium]
MWATLIQQRHRIAAVVKKDGEKASFGYVSLAIQNAIKTALVSLGYLARSRDRFLPCEPDYTVDLIKGTFAVHMLEGWVNIPIQQPQDTSPYSVAHMSDHFSFLTTTEQRLAYYRYKCFSWDEISKLVGLPLATVHRHWQDALAKIEAAVKNKEKPRPNKLTRFLARHMSGASVMNPANRWGEPTLWSISEATQAELKQPPNYFAAGKWVEQESSPVIWTYERTEETQRAKPCASANCVNGTDGAAHLPRFYRRLFGYSQGTCLLCRVGRIDGLWRKCPTCRLWDRLKGLCPFCKASAVSRAIVGIRGFNRFRQTQWRLPRRLCKDKPRLVRIFLLDLRPVAKEMFVPNPLPLGGGQVSWVNKGGWRTTGLDDYKWLGGAFVTHFESDGTHMLIFQDSAQPLITPYRDTVATHDETSRIVTTVPPLWVDDKPRDTRIVRTVSAGTAKALEDAENE